MRCADQHEAWEMKPRKLTIEEIEKPQKVIEEFFQYAHLPQARWYMWELVRAMVTGTYTQMRPKDRSSLLFFYEQMEKLIEGVHVMYERNYYRPLQESDK